MVKQSSLFNMALVLTLVCLGASAAVAVVYAITKKPIEIANIAKINNAIKEVVPEFNNEPSNNVLDVKTPEGIEGKVYVAQKGEEVVGYAVESSTNKGFGGPFTIMVGFTPDGTVFNTSVISHSETPGLGAKITDHSSKFIQWWNGKNLTDSSVKIAVVKDGGDVDAITASTITSRAYCDAMERAAAIIKFIQSNGIESLKGAKQEQKGESQASLSEKENEQEKEQEEPVELPGINGFTIIDL